MNVLQSCALLSQNNVCSLVHACALVLGVDHLGRYLRHTFAPERFGFGSTRRAKKLQYLYIKDRDWSAMFYNEIAEQGSFISKTFHKELCDGLTAQGALKAALILVESVVWDWEIDADETYFTDDYDEAAKPEPVAQPPAKDDIEAQLELVEWNSDTKTYVRTTDHDVDRQGLAGTEEKVRKPGSPEEKVPNKQRLHYKVVVAISTVVEALQQGEASANDFECILCTALDVVHARKRKQIHSTKTDEVLHELPNLEKGASSTLRDDVKNVSKLLHLLLKRPKFLGVSKGVDMVEQINVIQEIFQQYVLEKHPKRGSLPDRFRDAIGLIGSMARLLRGTDEAGSKSSGQLAAIINQICGVKQGLNGWMPVTFKFVYAIHQDLFLSSLSDQVAVGRVTHSLCTTKHSMYEAAQKLIDSRVSMRFKESVTLCSLLTHVVLGEFGVGSLCDRLQLKNVWQGMFPFPLSYWVFLSAKFYVVSRTQNRTC